MNKSEIKELINSNEVIKLAYERFRKDYRYSEIVDMYSMAHFSLPIDEAYIHFVSGANLMRWGYTKDWRSGETKISISRIGIAR